MLSAGENVNKNEGIKINDDKGDTLLLKSMTTLPFRDLLSLLCFPPRSPPDIQYKIFGDYLTIFDIGRLDTALHGRHLRETMLSIWRRRREGDEAVPVPVLVCNVGREQTMSLDCLQSAMDISTRDFYPPANSGRNIEDEDFYGLDIKLDSVEELNILGDCILSAETMVYIASKCVKTRESTVA